MAVTDLNDLSDEVLMKRYGKGNSLAFELLYQRHKAPLFRFFLRQLNDRAICEELYQDVWSKVISNRKNYKDTAKFTTWLYTIARNRLTDYFRTTVNSNNIVQSSNEDLNCNDSKELVCDMHPERIVESEDASNKLKELVTNLPTQQREAFILKYEGGFNHSDIAKITGQKQETIKSQVRYALNKLKAGLFGGAHE